MLLQRLAWVIIEINHTKARLLVDAILPQLPARTRLRRCLRPIPGREHRSLLLSEAIRRYERISGVAGGAPRSERWPWDGYFCVEKAVDGRPRHAASLAILPAKWSKQTKTTWMGPRKEAIDVMVARACSRRMQTGASYPKCLSYTKFALPRHRDPEGWRWRSTKTCPTRHDPPLKQRSSLLSSGD